MPGARVSLMERANQLILNRKDRRTVLKLIATSNTRALSLHEKHTLCGVLLITPEDLIEEPGPEKS